jgi:hypothetical protein
MAKYKRRVVYLSDEEWAELLRRSLAEAMPVSALIRKLVAKATSLQTNIGGPVKPRIELPSESQAEWPKRMLTPEEKAKLRADWQRNLAKGDKA